MSPTSYQAALPRVIPSLLSATLIIIPYSNGFVKRVRKVFLQRKQRMKTRLLTFFPENQQPRQFTPLREGRLIPSSRWRHGRNFNSRPSARGDSCRRHQWRGRASISIHAPPRGATLRQPARQAACVFQFTPLREGRQCPYPGSRPVAYFNSRPSARGDPMAACAIFAVVSFQFTPLREGRPDSQTPSDWQANFNSRPSARGDGFGARDGKGVGISIHAPPRGATLEA